MNTKHILHATHEFGPPIGWDPQIHGECGSLWVRKEANGDHVSAWQPTPEELALLNQGGVVLLRCVGGQPPVMLWAEPADAAHDDLEVGDSL